MSENPNDFTLDDRARLEAALGQRMVASRPVNGGCTPSLRRVVTLADGRSAFVKLATTLETARWLRDEARIYEAIAGDFMPRLLAWSDDEARPFLVLEDLSHATWPPPWTDRQVARVLEVLETVAAQQVPGLPYLVDDLPFFDNWAEVARNPEPFLSLGLASRAWLEVALPVLLAVDGRGAAAGEALLHLDVRSDTLCFVGDRVVLVDWNWAMRGNPSVDVAGWLPSLAMEGGPAPETILPDAGELAAVICGHFAANAGLSAVPNAPGVRPLQRRQLAAALPWMARALGLPAPDGGNEEGVG